ncbi:Phosphopentomutase [Dyadobacter sp. CECT 9275]|uniref:Phosphopentomutase n=1 Tax=Dyadobacter helix TaxID=2822344 RepID=A0A916JF61_9BACT|nr:alkaline phosphatase family protein [Dyadobacter sp. CECT 9275]CAG5005366.1 Phosphopentomutase [Dyadobacter sp. CECT 9275]
MKPIKLRPFAVLALAGISIFACKKSDQRFPEGIEHVVVIGVDGLSPDGIKKASTPVLDSMVANGVVKWNVRTVLTSSSSQNWASMIMGAGPEQHGIINNDWEMDDHTLPPVVQEPDGRFPTIFSLIRKNKPDAEIGTSYHWGGFGRLFQKNAVNHDKHFSTEDSTASDFISYIKTKKPTFAFMHLDHVDHAGHHDGHGTPAYYKSVSKADSLIGKVLEGIKEAGIEESTLVIITADHGGIGYGHGGATPQEAEIAMILYGKDVKKGYELKQQVYTYDLAATIAFAFNLTPPYAWIGRAIKPAFEGFDEPENLYLGQETIAQPVIYPDKKLYAQAGGLYINEKPSVKMSTPVSGGQIRYTTDGSEPDSSSAIYSNPFSLDRTTVIKARSFDGSGNESLVTTAYFRVLKETNGHGLTTTFYEGNELKEIPDYGKLKKGQSWVSQEVGTNTEQISSLFKNGNSSFALKFEGFIQIDKEGEYLFSTSSDDGSMLYIDGQKVVDNNGNHGVMEETGTIKLTAGKHAIRVEFYNNGGGFWLDAFYKGPGIAKQLIPADKLFLK